MTIVLVIVFIRDYSCLSFSLIVGLVQGSSQVITLRESIVMLAGGSILDGL
jgi:hypothetical protein